MNERRKRRETFAAGQTGVTLLAHSQHRPLPKSANTAPSFYPAFVLAMIFLLALPKGGIAVGGLPVTFGYVLLGALAPFSVLSALRNGGPAPAAIANFLFGYVPISALAMLKLLSNGSSYGLAIYAVTLVILPALMLLIHAPVLERLSERQIGEPVKWCLRFVVFWGLLNFVLFAVSKRFIEIPYLTINPLDLGDIYSKNNRRGILMKLVSTYNNGNIYGVCMVMLLPVYWYFERSRTWLCLFVLAIILSLSRTVWAGLIVVTFGMILSGQLRISRPAVWFSFGSALLMVVALLPLMGWTSDRVVDTNLGGRMAQWNDVVLSAFGQAEVRISEVLYAGLLQSFGIIGTLLALGALAFPVVYAMMNWQLFTPLRRAAVVGVGSYLLMAASDAAFIYPPTIAILLALCALAYRRGDRSASGTASRHIAGPRPLGPITLAEAAARLR